jgi:hypothetical protein
MPKDYDRTTPGTKVRDNARNQAIAEAVDAGFSFEEVGIAYDLTRQRIHQIYVRETGRKRPYVLKTYTCQTCGEQFQGRKRDHVAAAGPRHRERNLKRNDEWVALYADGISTTQIARMYGVYVGQVWHTLVRQRGVKLRPSGRPGGTQVRRKALAKPDDGRP